LTASSLIGLKFLKAARAQSGINLSATTLRKEIQSASISPVLNDELSSNSESYVLADALTHQS
jgi:hypothetical protein